MEKGSTSGLAEAYEALAIGDNDEGVVVEVDDIAPPVSDFRYAAVGRVVTDRPIKFVIFRDVMATAWRSEKGVHFWELGSQRFLFTFYQERDVSRVVDGGPWTFEQNLVAMRRLCSADDPLAVDLDAAEFWMQIHNLPVGFMSEKVATLVANSVGRCQYVDPKNFDGGKKSFLRVRVILNLSKPLKPKLKMKKPRGEWFWADLRYERLPSFCFQCGIIGHGDRYCPVGPEKVTLGAEKPFGSWLRAGGRRGTAAPVNRWLVLDEAAASVMNVTTATAPRTVTHDEALMSPLGHDINTVVNEGGGVRTGGVPNGKGIEGVVNMGEGSGAVTGLNDQPGSIAVTDDEDGDGVVVTDPKRRRTVHEGQAVHGHMSSFSPMVIEKLSSNDEVGAGIQAHPAQ